MLCLRLSELRKSGGFLQAEIAKHLSITQEAYSMYETNKRQMSFETLCLLADFYKVSTDYLLGREEAIPSFLNEDEREVIRQYQALDERSQDSVKNCLAFEYAHTQKTGDSKQAM
jgi:transcriptional regulator with XRE-family HTH domain